MRRFEPYPIYINHPGRWEAVRRRQRETFVGRGDFQMMNWLDSTGKRLYEITQDMSPGYTERDYEHQVFELLQLIASTRIGRLLLCSMNPGITTWIVPLDDLDYADCDCNAETFPGRPEEGGGIRIYFSPERFNGSAVKWNGADDVLFHELAHAYRQGRVGYEANPKPMGRFKNLEEFFAVQMQNLYLANRGGLRFYSAYPPRQAASKAWTYELLAGDPEAVAAFRYFLESDPLAAAMATLSSHSEWYNPWRDHGALEKRFLDGSGLKSVPRYY